VTAREEAGEIVKGWVCGTDLDISDPVLVEACASLETRIAAALAARPAQVGTAREEAGRLVEQIAPGAASEWKGHAVTVIAAALAARLPSRRCGPYVG
jgi:hypothetical protein